MRAYHLFPFESAEPTPLVELADHSPGHARAFQRRLLFAMATNEDAFASPRKSLYCNISGIVLVQFDYCDEIFLLTDVRGASRGRVSW
jgi:hypothetical protein